LALKKKTFDCVAMKREIQEQQRPRLAGLLPSEAARMMEQEILQDPELARLWRSAKRAAVSSR
jgi:hypothetical protein